MENFILQKGICLSVIWKDKTKKNNDENRTNKNLLIKENNS